MHRTFNLFVVACFLCIPFSGIAQKTKATEKFLSRMPPSMDGVTFIISNKMDKVAYIQKADYKMEVVMNGNRGKSYDEIPVAVFSVDGKRFAYAARTKAQWYIITDGNESILPDSISSVVNLTFSPDGSALSYIEKVKDKYAFVYRGNTGKLYDFIDEYSLQFSADGSKYIYTATDKGKQFLVANEKEGKYFDKLSFSLLTKDGNHLAFAVTDKGVSYAIIDSVESKHFDDIRTIVFSNDGLHYAMIAVHRARYMVVHDGIEKEKFRFIHSLTFSPDSRHLAYGVETNEVDKEGFSHWFVWDDKKYGPYETVVEGSLVFSHNSNHLAVKVEKHDNFFFVVDGKDGKQYLEVMQITFKFSPDDSRMVYGAEKYNYQRTVIEHEKDGPLFTEILSVAFSPDSKHVVYSAVVDGKSVVVTDGVKGKMYDMLLSNGEIQFDSPTAFHYLAVNNNNIYLVTEKL